MTRDDLEMVRKALVDSRKALHSIAKIEMPYGCPDGMWVARTLHCNDMVTAIQVRRAAQSLVEIDAALSRLEAQPEIPESPMLGVWRCSNCGDMQEAGDSRWRWNGEAWEHKCGDPQAGHHPARYFGEHPTPLQRREILEHMVKSEIEAGVAEIVPDEFDYCETDDVAHWLRQEDAAKHPTPPVECPARKALERCFETGRLHRAVDTDEYTALAVPCSPCPGCAATRLGDTR